MGVNETGQYEDNTPSSSGCAYTDGAQYVGCQVAAKGWPTPQNMGGGRRSSRKCKKCGKKSRARSCHCKSKKRGKKGGFIGKALVPFGLLAALKHTQKRKSKKGGKKIKKGGKSRKTRRR